MNLSGIQRLFSKDVIKLFNYIDSKGYSFTFGDAYRTPEMAAEYAQQGKGIVQSLHCKRLAIDINLFNEKGEYLPDTSAHEPFGEYWESLNPCNKWGGNFVSRKDGNHYERRE